MAGKKVGIAAVLALVLLCGGGLVCAGGGSFAWYRHQGQQEQDAYCVAARERTRALWLEAIARLQAELASTEQLREEHHAALERARLVRDTETADRYEGLIMTADNRVTALNIAIEAADELQTSVLTLPAADVARQAEIIDGMLGDVEIQAIFTEPMAATLSLQDGCD